MDQLLAGYRRFRDRSWPQQRRRFETLAKEGVTSRMEASLYVPPA